MDSAAPPRPSIVIHPPLSNLESTSTFRADTEASTSKKGKHKQNTSEPLTHITDASNRNSTATTLVYKTDSTTLSLPRPEPITIVLTFWEHCLWVLAPLLASAIVGGIMLFLILRLNAATAVIIVCILAYFALSFLLIGITGLEMRLYATRKWERIVERRTQYPWHSEAVPLTDWRQSWPATMGTATGLAETGVSGESDDPAVDEALQQHRLQHHRQALADHTCPECIRLEREQYRLHYEPEDQLDIGAESVRDTEIGTLTYGAAVRDKDAIPRATYKQHQWTYNTRQSKWPERSTYDPSMYSKARTYDEDEDEEAVNFVPRLSPNSLYGLVTSASSRATRGSLAGTPAFSKGASTSSLWNESQWHTEGMTPIIDHTGAGAHDDRRTGTGTEDGYMAGSSRGTSSHGSKGGAGSATAESAPAARANSPTKGYPQSHPMNADMSLSGRTLVPPVPAATSNDGVNTWMARTDSGGSKGKEYSPTRKAASKASSGSAKGQGHGHSVRPSLDRTRSDRDRNRDRERANESLSGIDVHLEPGDAKVLHSPRIWPDGEQDAMVAYSVDKADRSDLSLSMSGVKSGNMSGAASGQGKPLVGEHSKATTATSGSAPSGKGQGWW